MENFSRTRRMISFFVPEVAKLTRMNQLILKIKSLISSYSKVIENYFYSTSLQVINPLIGILIYPYLIRVLGGEQYGLYILALSVASYFSIVVAYGFSWIALKRISMHPDDILVKNETVSIVFTAKLILSVAMLLVLVAMCWLVPFFYLHQWILFLTFFQIMVPDLLFPTWFFQGIQKMKVVTYIQLSFKLLAIPFIFLLIKKPEDITLYAAIVASTQVLAGFVSVWYMAVYESIVLRISRFSKIKETAIEALPFFWTETVGVAKQESLTLIIGIFLSLHDVALYDLANKIVSIPRLMTLKVNEAIFPRLIKNPDNRITKNLMRAETLAGVAIVALIAAIGYWLVMLLGGIKMIEAYPLAIILSSTIISWLLVGCFLNFVFIPTQNFYFVTQSQLVALISNIVLCLGLLLVWKSVFVVVIASALSGFLEVAFCYYRTRQHRLLK